MLVHPVEVFHPVRSHVFSRIKLVIYSTLTMASPAYCVNGTSAVLCDLNYLINDKLQLSVEPVQSEKVSVKAKESRYHVVLSVWKWSRYSKQGIAVSLTWTLRNSLLKFDSGVCISRSSRSFRCLRGFGCPTESFECPKCPRVMKYTVIMLGFSRTLVFRL